MIGRPLQLFVLGITLLGMGAIGVLPLLPPSAVPAEAGDQLFSAERAAPHIPVIARQPHPMGSDANAEVREYLVGQLSMLGLEPQQQAFEAPDYYDLVGANTVEAVNIFARIAGDSSTGAILLMAHYDSVPTTFGANDDAAAIAAILESARTLLAGPSLRNDVILLFTDGEEPAPRYGATAFLQSHPWANNIAFVVNFEAIGSTGASVLVESAGAQSWVVGDILASTSRPAATSFLTSLNDLLGGADTDFAPFRDRGLPGLNFAYLHGSPVYHTLEDSPDNVDLDSVQHHGSYAVSITQLLGGADLSETPSDDGQVFFNLGPWLIHFTDGAALPLAVLAGIIFVFAAVMGARSGAWSPVAMAGASAKALVLVLGAGALMALGWTGVVAMQPSPGIAEGYFYILLLAGLVLGGLVWLNWRWSSKASNQEGLGSIVLLFVVLGVATAIVVPGASYVFTAPALAGGIALGWLSNARWIGWQLLAFLLAAAATLVLAIPVCDLLLQVSMPRPGNLDSELIQAIALPAIIAGLITLLLVEVGRGTQRADFAQRPAMPRD